MHWVIQQSIFRPEDYLLLTRSLDRLDIDYTSVTIHRGTYDMEPSVDVDGKVYVCGALKLSKISAERAWFPGSFLTEQFNFHQWHRELGSELLNYESKSGKFIDVKPDTNEFFIRPLEDNKAFDGMILDYETLLTMRREQSKEHLHDVDVVVSSVKQIYREYRLFVVKNQVVTGSIYKMGGTPHMSAIIEEDAVDYAKDIIKTWLPSESVVIDVALTDSGYKVVEFNNINSSGFYASDVQKYVQAIQIAYA